MKDENKKKTHWLKDAIIYQIMIDRFSRGTKADKNPSNCYFDLNYCGGTIRGIIEKLDYLEDLGINAIWLSPFNCAFDYHGYSVTDLYNVNEKFGTQEDLRELVDKAHSRGMMIIMDFVANHMSSEHPIFREAHDNKKSEYRKWFYFKRGNKYLCFYHFPQLAKINLDHKPARDHVVKAAKKWLSFGIDGMRLDHVIGPKHSFWKHFRKEIKKEFPDVTLIGEAWGFEGQGKSTFRDVHTINIRGRYFKYFTAAQDKTMLEYVGELDGTVDFRFKKLMTDYIAKDGSNVAKEKLKVELKKHYASFPNDFYLPSFIDNHDMNRFLFDAGGDKNKLKDAVKIQFEQEQPIIIYYGTEVGMSQEKDMKEYGVNGDREVRRMMPWWAIDEDLLEFYKDLIKKRKEKRNNLNSSQ